MWWHFVSYMGHFGGAGEGGEGRGKKKKTTDCIENIKKTKSDYIAT